MKLLENNQIHIWKVNVNNSELDINNLLSNVLSDDERKRAIRLRSDKDKRRFVVSRGLLRKNLGQYMDTNPAQIVFDYNSHGKPSIRTDDNNKNIKFNVSHSRELAIYAICLNKEIGVDVEYIRDVGTADKIIKRFFTEEEKSFYNSLSEHKKKLGFFTLWTRKEAYSKARGMGIGLPLKDFDINLVQNEGNSINKSKWSLIDLDIDKDYLAALATEGNNMEICRFETA